MSITFWNNWISFDEMILLDIAMRRIDDQIVFTCGLAGFGAVIVFNIF